MIKQYPILQHLWSDIPKRIRRLSSNHLLNHFIFIGQRNLIIGKRKFNRLRRPNLPAIHIFGSRTDKSGRWTQLLQRLAPAKGEVSSFHLFRRKGAYPFPTSRVQADKCQRWENRILSHLFVLRGNRVKALRLEEIQGDRIGLCKTQSHLFIQGDNVLPIYVSPIKATGKECPTSPLHPRE